MGKELQKCEKCEKSENILHHNMGDESAYSSEIHVLAVDDSNIDRKVIERLLKTSSFKVTAVDSALRALEVLGVADGCTSIATNAYHINLIITDYCMPDMAGYDLLKRVKEVSSLREIPVVIMSSENVPNRIKRCLEEGAEEFIIKPVRLADVKRLRRHVVKQTNCHEEENIAPCFKRKLATDTQQIASSERRTRPRGLTVP